MKCMSCRQRKATVRFQKMMLCDVCLVLANKAQAELDRRIDDARVQSAMWLEQHILKGGLVLPNTGFALPGLGNADAPRG